MKMYQLVGGAMLVFAAVSSVGLVSIDAEYSQGDRSGTVTKISHKGFVCKTWEGQMSMDNFVPVTNADGTKSMSNSFNFSVKDISYTDANGQTHDVKAQDIVKELQAASQDRGGRYDLHYKQVWHNGACASDTDYYIVDVTKTGTQPATAPKFKPGS